MSTRVTMLLQARRYQKSLDNPGSSAGNAFLYTCKYFKLEMVKRQGLVALGLSCIGLLLTCVGLGERGFHSPFLKLLGPSIFSIGNILKTLNLIKYLCMIRTFDARFENHNVLLSQNDTKQDARIRGRLL